MTKHIARDESGEAMTSTPPAELDRALHQRGGVREGEEIRFRCPYPERHRNGDEHPSARYNPTKAVWCCDVCEMGGGWIDLADLLDVAWQREEQGIKTTYRYTDECGELLFEVVRRVPKDFRQRQPDGNGGWIWNTKGVRRVLYRLPEVLAASQPSRPSQRPWGGAFSS